ncbi:MAG: enoyl-CoA hydratase-related protein [Fidelibacterota bacterium]
MSYQTISVHYTDHIANITLNRPETRNALNGRMIQEIASAFSTFQNDSNVRLIILSGNGISFCAGADLKLMRHLDTADKKENVEFGTKLEEMYHVIDSCPKPVIGKIHGHAYGGGFGLCTVCDIVISDEKTLFSLSEVLIGIIPAIIGPYSVKKIGYSYFRSLGISGERFDGKFAEQIGLVHYSVKNSELDRTTDSVVKQLLKASPQAISHFKNYCNNFDVINSAELLAELRASDEGREGLTAFIEKRPPSWENTGNKK